MRTSLLIPAAGRGTRFGTSLPKQLLLLAGRPILLRSVECYLGLVDEVVIAVADDLRDDVLAALMPAAARVPIRTVSGGATRQESVHAALRASDAGSARILVHDAVRPLVPRACIAACLAALDRQVAAVVAVPCAATVKRARPGDPGLVDTTVPRDGLWLAQTPQGFHRAVGLAAFAAATGRACSDDVQVLELAGHTVALVPGDARNLKITTPDDLVVAEALIAAAGLPHGRAP